MITAGVPVMVLVMPIGALWCRFVLPYISGEPWKIAIRIPVEREVVLKLTDSTFPNKPFLKEINSLP